MPEIVGREQSAINEVNDIFQEGQRPNETFEEFMLRLAAQVIDSRIETPMFFTKGQAPKTGTTPQS